MSFLKHKRESERVDSIIVDSLVYLGSRLKHKANFNQTASFKLFHADRDLTATESRECFEFTL